MVYSIKNQIMKNFIVVLLMLTGLSAIAQKNKNADTMQVYIGKGMGGILFSISTEEQVTERFGSDYWPEEIIIKQYFDEKTKKNVTIYNFKMKYIKKGLIFNFTKEEGKPEMLTSIEIFPPFIVRTKEGIILGQSTLDDVVKTYGYGQWGYSNKNQQVTKTYDGIAFYVTNKKNIKEFDKDYFNATFLPMVIDKIVITSDPKAVFYLDK